LEMLKRYDMEQDDTDFDASMEERKFGKYLKYDDVIALLASHPPAADGGLREALGNAVWSFRHDPTYGIANFLADADKALAAHPADGGLREALAGARKYLAEVNADINDVVSDRNLERAEECIEKAVALLASHPPESETTGMIRKIAQMIAENFAPESRSFIPTTAEVDSAMELAGRIAALTAPAADVSHGQTTGQEERYELRKDKRPETTGGQEARTDRAQVPEVQKGDTGERVLSAQGSVQEAELMAAYDSYTALREALRWALNKLRPWDHYPECSPTKCVCGWDKATAALATRTAETPGLREALEDANDLCRSAMQIALRHGLSTNWNAFSEKLLASLERQRAALATLPAETQGKWKLGDVDLDAIRADTQGDAK
jgi:hypothetical protein